MTAGATRGQTLSLIAPYCRALCEAAAFLVALCVKLKGCKFCKCQCDQLPMRAQGLRTRQTEPSCTPKIYDPASPCRGRSRNDRADFFIALRRRGRAFIGGAELASRHALVLYCSKRGEIRWGEVGRRVRRLRFGIIDRPKDQVKQFLVAPR